MDDESKLSWVGTWFTKEFDGLILKGAVMSFNAPYYEILYEDGDAEELSLTEIKKLLASERRRIRDAEREYKRQEIDKNKEEKV